MLFSNSFRHVAAESRPLSSLSDTLTGYTLTDRNTLVQHAGPCVSLSSKRYQLGSCLSSLRYFPPKQKRACGLSSCEDGPSDTHEENVTKHNLMEMLVILLLLLGGGEKVRCGAIHFQTRAHIWQFRGCLAPLLVPWGIHPKLKQPRSRLAVHFVHLRNTASSMLTPSIWNWA